MTVAIQPAALGTAPRAPDSILGALAYQLERELTSGPMPRSLQDVQDAVDLAPVATADQVRWRHAPVLQGHPVVRLIARTLDDARLRVVAARTAWPPMSVPMSEQCAALGQARADLRVAAEQLLRAEEMAVCNGLALAVSVRSVPAPLPRNPIAAAIHSSVYVRA